MLERRSTSSHTIEGRIVTGRSLRQYERILGITPDLLEGARVLNFGSGASHLNKQLAAKDIDSSVVELDIQYDPYLNDFTSPFRQVVAASISGLSHFLRPNTELSHKFARAKRKSAEIDGRMFIQADGRNLPFADETFDFVLAQWAANQIPSEAKETVFRELMRVGTTIHAGPIFNEDFKILKDLAAVNHYNLVACQPLPEIPQEPIPFTFSKKGDYKAYMEKHKEEERVVAPTGEHGEVLFIGNFPLGSYVNGASTIVLQKQAA